MSHPILDEGAARRPPRVGPGLASALLATLVVGACAPARFSFPSDPGAPFSDVAAAHRQATAACAGVKTFTAELGLSGRAGGRRIRGRAIVGFARPASMRLEVVAPFGPPAFILAARDGAAVLLLPRDRRILRGEAPEDILRVLTGVGLAPPELQAVLTGCVTTAPIVERGALHDNGWLAVDFAGGGAIYLERTPDGWRPRAARRSGWQIEYSVWTDRYPQTVRLRAEDPTLNVDVIATVSQIEANIAIDSAAFDVDVPPGVRPLTLDELRRSGPLGER